MHTHQSNDKLWTRDFIFISLCNLFLFFSFQMLLATMPMFVNDHGGNESVIGLVIGIFTIFSLITRPFVGVALARGQKKTILIIGLFICFIGIGGYYWTASVAAILFVRCIHGVGWAISTTTSGTIAADIIPASKRGEGIGYFGLASTIAMAIAPATGLKLVEATGGFMWLFLVATMVAFLSVVLVMLIRNKPQQANIPNTKSSLGSQLIEKKALFPSFLGMLVGMSYGSIVSFITLFAKEVGITHASLFFTTNAVCLFLVRLVGGKIFDRYGPTWIIIPGGFSMMIGMLVLSTVHSTPGLLIAAVFVGFGFGALQPSLQAWILNIVPAERRGPANATFYSAFDLGIGGGAMLLGPIAGWTSYATMYRLASLLMVALVLSYVWSLRKSKQPQEQPSSQSA